MEFAFRSAGPDEALSLSAGSANACRWSAKLGRRFGISVWLDPLQQAACPSADKAPESIVRAAVYSAQRNHPLGSQLPTSGCLDPPNDSVVISTLADPCLLP